MGLHGACTVGLVAGGGGGGGLWERGLAEFVVAASTEEDGTWALSGADDVDAASKPLYLVPTHWNRKDAEHCKLPGSDAAMPIVMSAPPMSSVVSAVTSLIHQLVERDGGGRSSEVLASSTAAVEAYLGLDAFDEKNAWIAAYLDQATQAEPALSALHIDPLAIIEDQDSSNPGLVSPRMVDMALRALAGNAQVMVYAIVTSAAIETAGASAESGWGGSTHPGRRLAQAVDPQTQGSISAATFEALAMKTMEGDKQTGKFGINVTHIPAVQAKAADLALDASIGRNSFAWDAIATATSHMVMLIETIVALHEGEAMTTARYDPSEVLGSLVAVLEVVQSSVVPAVALLLQGTITVPLFQDQVQLQNLLQLYSEKCGAVGSAEGDECIPISAVFAPPPNVFPGFPQLPPAAALPPGTAFPPGWITQSSLSPTVARAIDDVEDADDDDSPNYILIVGIIFGCAIGMCMCVLVTLRAGASSSSSDKEQHTPVPKGRAGGEPDMEHGLSSQELIPHDPGAISLREAYQQSPTSDSLARDSAPQGFHAVGVESSESSFGGSPQAPVGVHMQHAPVESPMDDEHQYDFHPSPPRAKNASSLEGFTMLDNPLATGPKETASVEGEPAQQSGGAEPGPQQHASSPGEGLEAGGDGGSTAASAFASAAFASARSPGGQRDANSEDDFDAVFDAAEAERAVELAVQAEAEANGAAKATADDEVVEGYSGEEEGEQQAGAAEEQALSSPEPAGAGFVVEGEEDHSEDALSEDDLPLDEL